MARNNNFTSKSIILYIPQRDKALGTSNKKVIIIGTCN
jgi:hypothetical protein